MNIQTPGPLPRPSLSAACVATCRLAWSGSVFIDKLLMALSKAIDAALTAPAGRGKALQDLWPEPV